MSVTRVLQYGVLAVFTVVTLAAFVFTMTRIQLLPMSVLRFSYAMMAPYQTFANRNADLLAQGVVTGDAMVKTAEVTLLQATTLSPGKYWVLIGGDVATVRASMKRAASRICAWASASLSTCVKSARTSRDFRFHS